MRPQGEGRFRGGHFPPDLAASRAALEAFFLLDAKIDLPSSLPISAPTLLGRLSSVVSKINLSSHATRNHHWGQNVPVKKK